MEFKVSGTFLLGGEKQEFSRIVEAEKEDEAKEKVLSLLGSEHGCKRRWIEIKEVGKPKQ